MPLTALTAAGELVDGTQVPDAAWAAIHKVRPRAVLRCRRCDGSMKAKVSSRGLRFFAHDHVRPDCPSHGETAEHLWLKSRLSAIVRSSGWVAWLEAEPDPADAGGWRADVLAVSPDGTRRVALEAQQSPMTAAEGAERTQRYAQDGVETVWFTMKKAPWLWKIAGCKLRRDEDVLDEDGEPSLVVTKGYVTRTGASHTSIRKQWAVTELPLPALVASVFDRSVTVHTLGTLEEWVPYGDEGREIWHTDAQVIVPSEDLQRDLLEREREAQRRELQEKRDREEAARHQANIDALHARQERALPFVVAHVGTMLGPGESVWLGVPATPLHHEGDLTIKNSVGNDRTARGAVVWAGGSGATRRLAAVICPVAGRLSRSLAANWDSRGTEVFASDAGEARRLASALGWPASRVRIVGTEFAPYRPRPPEQSPPRQLLVAIGAYGDLVRVDRDTGEIVERLGKPRPAP